jgi:N-hydroxyarylamine O-acetyltransferase
MDVSKYLRRINCPCNINIDEESLFLLHENHILNVPFENLDVYYKKLFDLDIDNLFNKVVINFRGGFCYELNTLFNLLLRNLGFNSKTIAARIFDDQGNLGPEFDHMSIIVETDKKYLLDVGYGDLFLKPLEIKDGVQSDGIKFFEIEKHDGENFLLSMSSDNKVFEKKYSFNLSEVQASDFNDICLFKQSNPNSYFVKNTICTKPTQYGRLTVFNNKFIEKINNDRVEKTICNDTELNDVLLAHFNIRV